jgi:hypothetical protein
MAQTKTNLTDSGQVINAMMAENDMLPMMSVIHSQAFAD